MPKFALIGYPLSHSFSKRYFTEKFTQEEIDSEYINIETPKVECIRELVDSNDLSGFNVTIPYKEAIIPYLDELDETAQSIGAVNTVKVERRGGEVYLKGYNTDVIGFGNSLKPLLKGFQHKALILGTGGASKAVAYHLNNLGLDVFYASRKPTKDNLLNYADINELVIRNFLLIVNTTPLGTYPEVESFPEIPYQFIGVKHLLYDLVYNPKKTEFLKKGEAQGAAIKNGYDMLVGQAEAAYSIWNKN